MVLFRFLSLPIGALLAAAATSALLALDRFVGTIMGIAELRPDIGRAPGWGSPLAAANGPTSFRHALRHEAATPQRGSRRNV